MHPDVLAYAMARDRDRRRAIRQNARAAVKANKRARREDRQAIARAQQPNRYRKIVSGEKIMRRKPQSRVEDRRYVPAALRNWRLTHDLTPEQAQARVGMSPRSCSWRHYEDGYMAPPYMTLLRIIAATGMGTLLDRDAGRGEVDPQLLLEKRHAEFVAHRLRTRRRKAPRVQA